MYTHPNGVSLRRMDYEDLEYLTAQRYEAWDKYHQIVMPNRSSQAEWFHAVTKDPSTLVLVGTCKHWFSPSTGVQDYTIGPFGTITLSRIDQRNQTAWLGEDVWEGYRGQGLGVKITQAGMEFAFNELNLYRLDAEVIAGNEASRKTLIHAGFRLEGVKKHALFRHGQRYDVSCLAALRPPTESPRG